MPKQEKVIFKMVGNFMAFLFTLASLPPQCCTTGRFSDLDHKK